MFDRHPAPYRARMNVSSLSTAEVFTVIVIRLWTAAVIAPDWAPGDWRDGLRRAGLDEKRIAAFNSLLEIMAGAATRGIDIRPPGCPYLGDDEARFLDAVGAAQQNRQAEANAILSGWLPPAAIRVGMPFLSAFSLALGKQGLLIPVRARYRDSTDTGRTIGMSPDPGLRFVH